MTAAQDAVARVIDLGMARAEIEEIRRRRPDAIRDGRIGAQLRHPTGRISDYDPVSAYPALLVLARQWTAVVELAQQLGMTEEKAIAARARLAAGLTPGIAPVLAGILMDGVADAVARLEAFRAGDLDASEVVSSWSTGRRDEAALGQLQTDVDDAVFPLLTGASLPHRCPTCSRVASAPHQRVGEGLDRLCLAHAVRAQ